MDWWPHETAKTERAGCYWRNAMSAHDWPEFDEANISHDNYGIPYACVNRDEYNYAKVRIDACGDLDELQLQVIAEKNILQKLATERDALQQRCDELVDALKQAEMDVEAIKLCLHPRDASFTQVAISKIRHSLSKQVQP